MLMGVVILGSLVAGSLSYNPSRSFPPTTFSPLPSPTPNFRYFTTTSNYATTPFPLTFNPATKSGSVFWVDGSAWSADTFTTHVDTSIPGIDSCEGVVWRIEYDDAAGVHHVIEGVPEFPPGEGPEACP